MLPIMWVSYVVHNLQVSPYTTKVICKPIYKIALNKLLKPWKFAKPVQNACKDILLNNSWKGHILTNSILWIGNDSIKDK
jgi:hypothetical protein